jgi:hypothetical protein
MKKITLLSIFVLSNLGYSLIACSCLSFSTFCEAVDSDSKVVEVEVLEKYIGSGFPTFMDVKILETLQGTVTEESITIISYGTSCDVFFDIFEIGEKLVLRFNDLETGTVDAHFPTTHFGACTTSFLQFSDDQIVGSIEPGVDFKNYDDFKNEIGDCSDLTLFDKNPEKLNEFIYLFPNPTFDFLNVNFSILDPDEISLEFFSATGQQIIFINNNIQNNYPIDLSSLAHGVYFLKITYRKTSIVKRVVKI